MALKINAVQGFFFKGKYEKKKNQKEYIFAIPETLIPKIDTTRAVLAFVPGKDKNGKINSHTVPFVVTRWLVLSDEELAKHSPITTFKYPHKIEN
ncbi:hypothetical protein [Weissella minor]|uniref:hypothetical protein n=1 Tax=Weissella minor TaxID=1620 RepID=UPI003AF2800A